ncbi:MAG TPA: amidase [Thermoanaerobaculia bacterium]|jgi:aspartyl-tRNA(Asn)/glutamyl-tRNA(Gln) amidotransferase subunit A
MSIGEDVLYLTVGELAQRIAAQKLSPVELTEAYLRRSETLGATLNAYVTLTHERALAEARAAESEISAGRYRGPLHGIPYAAKDLLAADGYPTTWGARPYANQKFAYDANVIKRLNAAGAVLIGKAAMIELAGGMGYRFGTASLTGGAKNPWNVTCWTCGSSSGSGAIVAAGLAAFAIGTETWGSIICPSASCGVSGLRPTFGRVGRGGAMALSYSMDKIGPMARSADDCGFILAALAAHDRGDRHSLPADEASFGYETKPRALRIGRLTNAWGANLQPEIAALTEAAFTTLRNAGATIVDVELPEGPWEMAAAVTIQVEGASAFDELIDSGRVAELTDPGSRLGGYVNRTISGHDYLRAQRLRTVLQEKIDPLFDRVDVLAAASLPIVATPLEANLEVDFAFSDPLGGIGNACGLPAISVPSGFTEKGLPAGIQFVGRALDDNAVLAAARLFQSKTNWHRRHPRL